MKTQEALTELNRNKVTIGSVTNTWKNLTCDSRKLLRVAVLCFPSAISDSFIPPYGYTSITLDFGFLCPYLKDKQSREIKFNLNLPKVSTVI